MAEETDTPCLLSSYCTYGVYLKVTLIHLVSALLNEISVIEEIASKWVSWLDQTVQEKSSRAYA